MVLGIVTSLTRFERHRVLLLNADFRPLGFPLLTLTAQQVISAMMLERVTVVRDSDVIAHAPRMKMRLPSVVALKKYISMPGLQAVPAFNRFNLFVRDGGLCQYTGEQLSYRSLDVGRRATIDHVIPVCRGGKTNWMNCVMASMAVNIQKGGRAPHEAGLSLLHEPWQPTCADLLTLWLTDDRLRQLDPNWTEFLALEKSSRVQRVLEKWAA